jgi:predicted phage-related endonuclease
MIASNEIIREIEELAKIKEQMKALETRYDELKNSVTQYMKYHNFKMLCNEDGVHLCTHKTIVGERFDSKWLKEKYPRIHNRFLIDTIQERLTLVS